MHMKRKWTGRTRCSGLRSTSCFLVLLLLPPGAAAASEALMELLRALHENGTIDAQTYQQVRTVAEQENGTGLATPEHPAVVEDTGRAGRAATAGDRRDAGIQITTRGKFEVLSEDGDFSFRIGGRVETDVAFYREDGARHNDGTEIRRARLFASGTLWEHWKYKLQYDFTGSGINGLQDTYLEYRGPAPVSLRIGHFKEPFGLQNMASEKYLLFTERALLHAFTPGRNIGVQIATGGSNWTLAAGLFGEGRDGALADDDEGIGISTRGTIAPMLTDRTRVHLGAALSYRNTGSVDSVRFRQRPESHVTKQFLVDTGPIETGDFLRAGLEAALISGAFSLESEYHYVDINRRGAALPDPAFSGFYVQGGWFITGESSPYNPRRGVFGKPVLNGVVGKGGTGALQLAMRYSSLDLNDADINGGDAQTLTFGLKWYTTPNIHLSANYVKTLEVNGGPADESGPDAVQLRAEVQF